MLEKAWLYILASDRGVLYIGVTSNLYKRILEHRAGFRSGFATKYKCHRLIYFEEFAYMTSAIAREKELKGWRRSKKLALIREKNEYFKDLADGWGKSLPGFEFNNHRLNSRHSDDQREEKSPMHSEDAVNFAISKKCRHSERSEESLMPSIAREILRRVAPQNDGSKLIKPGPNQIHA